MKIVQISTSTTGGAGIAAKRLHLGLQKQENISCSLIERFRRPEEQDSSDNIFTIYPKVCLRYRIEKRLKTVPEWKNYRTIGDMPRDYETVTFPTSSYRLEELPIVKDADIIHLHWVSNFVNYQTFFRKIKQPIVWTLHDMNPFLGIFHYEEDKIRNRSIFGELEDKYFEIKQKAIHTNKNIHVVCLSEWMKNKSENSSTFKQYPHQLIPNGLNFSNFENIDRLQAKSALNIDPTLKTILFIAHGIDVKRKGGDILINAIKRLDNSHKFNVITVGGGTQIEFRTNNIVHKHFERISDLHLLNQIYSAADITAIPSREDNLPNVMLESFANGTPIISFSNGGMAEYTQNGKNGIIINNIDIDLFTQELEKFINGAYVFDHAYIRKYAISQFSESDQVNKYLELYKNILNR